MKTLIVFYISSLILFMAETNAQGVNLIEFGVGSGFVLPNHTQTAFSNDFSGQLKIVQGLDIFSSYRYYLNDKSSVLTGIQLSFDKLEASTFEINNPENNQLMNTLSGQNNITQLLIYTGYGYDIRMGNKNLLNIGMVIGMPFFFDGNSDGHKYVSADDNIIAKSSFYRHGRDLNLLINPNLRYSKILGERGNRISLYCGYSQLLKPVYEGHITVNNTIAGNEINTWLDFYYQALDFGVVYAVKF